MLILEFKVFIKFFVDVSSIKENLSKKIGSNNRKLLRCKTMIKTYMFRHKNFTKLQISFLFELLLSLIQPTKLLFNFMSKWITVHAHNHSCVKLFDIRYSNNKQVN